MATICSNRSASKFFSLSVSTAERSVTSLQHRPMRRFFKVYISQRSGNRWIKSTSEHVFSTTKQPRGQLGEICMGYNLGRSFGEIIWVGR